MATSKCPSCGSTSFEVVEKDLPNFKYKMLFIQCAPCGSVVGTTTYFDAGMLAKQNQKAMEELKKEVASILARVSRMK